MFNPLKGLGDLNALQQQAKKMQQALQQEEIEIDHKGVKITVRGDQIILKVIVDGVEEARITEAVNSAIKKTQELAAKKLMSMGNE